MSFDAIYPGLKGEIDLVVAEEHGAQHLGSGAVGVLATPQMVLLMERASVAAVDPLLPAGSCTVGVHLDIRHLEPTPIGLEVRAVAELVGIDGRRLSFRLRAFEEPFGEDHLVGDGIHERVIVNRQGFVDRAARKLVESS
ncbi:MAG: thioesterase family protein [Anaerolineae bacterium]